MIKLIEKITCLYSYTKFHSRVMDRWTTQTPLIALFAVNEWIPFSFRCIYWRCLIFRPHRRSWNWRNTFFNLFTLLRFTLLICCLLCSVVLIVFSSVRCSWIFDVFMDLSWAEHVFLCIDFRTADTEMLVLFVLQVTQASFHSIEKLEFYPLWYDTIDRHGMWQKLRVYGVGGKLYKALESFYVDSRACVRVGNDVSDWFPVNVGLRQGCAMSPWSFNVYMDGVVREVNVWVLGKGLELLSANGGWF